MKPKADGRKDGSSGQRGILGFEWRTAPLPIMPLPTDVLLAIDTEVCVAEEPRDDEALEREYAAVLMSMCDQTDAPVAKKTRAREEPTRETAPRKRKETAPRGRKRKAANESTGAAAKKQCTLADFAA